MSDSGFIANPMVTMCFCHNSCSPLTSNNLPTHSVVVPKKISLVELCVQNFLFRKKITVQTAPGWIFLHLTKRLHCWPTCLHASFWAANIPCNEIHACVTVSFSNKVRQWISHTHTHTHTHHFICNALYLVASFVSTLLTASNTDEVRWVISTRNIDLGVSGSLNLLQPSTLFTQDTLVVFFGNVDIIGTLNKDSGHHRYTKQR